MGSAAGSRADQIGRRGCGDLGGGCGQLCGARPLACCRRSASGQPGERKKAVRHPADEALGRSRSGLTTKLHLSCNGRGRPLSVVLTGGQVHDSTQLAAVLDAISMPDRVAAAARVNGQTTCWLTRATATPRADACCGGAGSPTPFPNGAISWPGAPHVPANRFLSMPPTTRSAIWSNGASIVSSSGAASRPGTTNAPSTTAPP